MWSFFTEGDSCVIRKYDAAADLEQILESTERRLRQQEYLEPEKVNVLLEKLKEMKTIAAGGEA